MISLLKQLQKGDGLNDGGKRGEQGGGVGMGGCNQKFVGLPV